MKLFNKAVIVLSLASIFCVGACKKNAEPPKNTEEIVQSIKSWDKSEVNSLLGYIPADSPVVVVSTRQVDVSHPAFSKMLSKGLRYYDDSLKAYERQLDEYPDETGTRVLSSLKSLRPLIENFETNAPEWGLDPKGHADAAIYMDGDSFVVKLTVADIQKVKAKMDTFLSDWILIAKQEVNSPEIKFTELKAGNSTWYVHDISAEFEDIKDTGAELPSMLAYNLDNNIITFTTVKSGDTATLEKLLKIKDKPLTKDALGKVETDVQVIGYVDNVKLVTQLLNSETGKTIAKEGNFELTPVCIKDATSLVSMFPKLRFNSKLDPSGEASANAVLEMSDKEELKKIQALTVEHLAVGSNNSLAFFNLNLDLENSIAYLQDTLKRLNERKFECESMNPLVPELWVETFNGIVGPQTKLITSTFSGVNIAIDKLNLEGKSLDVEAVANVSGPKLASNYPMLAGMAAMKDPELGKLLIMKKGEIKNIDLSEQLQMPIKVNALMTDNDIVVGTETYDVKALSEGKRTKDGTILSFGFNAAIVNSLGLDLGGITVPDSTSSLSLGVSDEGFTIKTASKL